MSESANNKKSNGLGFTSVQAYTLAVITLAIGIAVGYFARGSAPAPAANETAQASSAPAGMGGGAMGGAQLPGIGSAQQQQGASPEMIAKAAEPLLAQLKTNPNDFDTIVKLGNLYYDGQAYPQAIEYYQKALNIQPNNPDVRTDMGTAYWFTGNADQAIANFDKSLAIRPNHPGTLFNLGIVQWQGKKDPKAAIVVWEKLLQTNPDYPQKDQVQSLIERAKMHASGATKG
ncbi:MAG: tetratricopeptide repeat protein [Candidatus Korobacteraceae bacterium]|jgi:cytochrome c-type biogenesis protein CcmH/NrfG